MTTYNHIFFDLDNTLWDSLKNSRCALKEMFIEKKIEKDIDFDEFLIHYERINEHLWSMLRDNKISKRQLRKERFTQSFLKMGIEDRDLCYWFEEQFPYRAIRYNHLVEGASESLDALSKKGFTLHILTNGFKEVSRKKVLLTDLKGRFETLVCADEIGIRKPNPRIFQIALESANAIKSESVFVGDDWLADAVGAMEFGMKSIYFNRWNTNNSHPDVLVINHLKELLSILI